MRTQTGDGYHRLAADFLLTHLRIFHKAARHLEREKSTVKQDKLRAEMEDIRTIVNHPFMSILDLDEDVLVEMFDKIEAGKHVKLYGA